MSKTRFMPVLAMVGILTLAGFSGCAADKMNNIPAGATLASSGNSQLTYTASMDGTVWVYDTVADRIDYSGALMSGQSITVNPDTRQIMIDARVVSDKTMNQGTQHQIFFQAMTH